MRLVIVSLYAPPSTASAVRRPAGLTRHLAALGHEVVVVTSRFSGEAGEIPGAAEVHRTRDLLTTRLNWRRGNLDAVRGTGAALEVLAPSRVAWFFAPDLQIVSWLPFLAATMRRVLDSGDVDGVLTTGPPHSTHLAGLMAARRGVPWLVELRDGWVYEPSGDVRPAGPLRRVDAWLEGRVMRRADAAMTVSPPLSDDLARRHGVRAEWIPLAYDPDEMTAADAAATVPDPLIDPGRHTLLYTGSVVATPRAAHTLLAGVADLITANPATAGRLQVLFVGPVTREMLESVTALGLTSVVECHGSVQRTRALALQRQADSLLVLGADDRTSILTNKLVEYLVTGRPLLVVGAETVAGEITRNAAAGEVVSITDPHETTTALTRLLDGTAARAAGNPAAEWSYPAIARRVADLFSQIAATRQAGDTP